MCPSPGASLSIPPAPSVSWARQGRVYATPALISDIEYTCRDGILAHLDPGEDSVGTRVELDHLAPTLPGMAVEITVTLAEVKGRLVTFDVIARDTLDEIGRGRHVRFVVDTAKTLAACAPRRRERLAAHDGRRAACPTRAPRAARAGRTSRWEYSLTCDRFSILPAGEHCAASPMLAALSLRTPRGGLVMKA